MPFVTAHDGAQLHYAVHDYTDPWKKAPTLILQHGFGRSGCYWFNLIPYLARHYKVVCPDLRGLGQSTIQGDPEKAIGVENYLRDILTVADHLELESFHYAGESLGGMLGMALTALHHDRVRSLTLMSSSLTLRPEVVKAFAFEHPSWQDALRTLGSRGWADAANKNTRFPPGSDPQLLEWYAAEFGKSDVNVLIAMSKVAKTVNLNPHLANIRRPVLGLYPTDGSFAKSGEEAVMKQGIRDLKMIHFPTTFHMVWVLSPAACATHMLHFMGALDGLPVHEA